MRWIIDHILELMKLAKPENLQAMLDKIGGPMFGYALLFAIIFSETGLLVGFFLPGDSLLFAAGALSSQQILDVGTLLLLLTAAAILGDAVNYYLGLQTGEHVFEKGRIRFVKHEHLLAAKEFYERHGGKAIVLARFVPLVRTFTPFVAGVARMGYRQFAFYNIIGGVAWVFSMTLAGYFFGQIPFIKEHFEHTVLLIVFVSVLPIAIGILKSWLAKRRVSAGALAEAGDAAQT